MGVLMVFVNKNGGHDMEKAMDVRGGWGRRYLDVRQWTGPVSLQRTYLAWCRALARELHGLLNIFMIPRLRTTLLYESLPHIRY